MNDQYSIAYFSMEIGLDPTMPTYSGGLGVLAGDTIRASADLGVPMIAVSLLHRKGYFRQKLHPDGGQQEELEEWVVEDFFTEMPPRVSVTIEGRIVRIRAWSYEVEGENGFKVPIFFLDTDLPENSGWDRTLTHYLYGGDQYYRLCQEMVLGIGGVRMLRALGYDRIERFHMNEGHSSLLTLELLQEELTNTGKSKIDETIIENVRKRCIFTTHTPVPTGHDQFPLDLVYRVLEYRDFIFGIKEVFCCEGLLNMTYLALRLSGYVNGVARRHGEISRLMFAGYTIDAITNGVHAASWVSLPFQKLFDRYIPLWKKDNFSLRYALSIPKEEIWKTHQDAKEGLIHLVCQKTGLQMKMDSFTIGFARRATAYKRGDLLFTDMDRLRRISSEWGPLQIIYAGKAHPKDHEGKEMIRRIFQAIKQLGPEMKMVYLENYDVEIARSITSGVDLWLNTPQPPMEASGTSGMKAALNGVPSLSILDGWWIEGCIEGVTGWAIGRLVERSDLKEDQLKDASSLYEKLEQKILPLFYRDRESYIEVMRYAIAFNGSFFNTHRMIQEYVLKAYFQ